MRARQGSKGTRLPGVGRLASYLPGESASPGERVESGGGSNNEDGLGSRTPPDEQQMRMGRSRVARGFDPSGEANTPAGASSGLVGSGTDDNSSFIQGNRQSAEGAEQGDGIDIGSRFGSWSDKSQAGSGPLRCHFLRSVGADGRLAEPQKTAVPTHRCAAYGDPLPLSLRQQELVCLQRVHVSCPRYVRGTLLANENQVQPATQERRAGGIPLLVIVAGGLVALSIVVVVGGLLGLGPLGGSGGHPQVAQASPTASATPSITRGPSASPTAHSSSTASATASPTALPTATLTVRPTATPGATSSWPPGATASRMNLVVPCTGQANCYVYTVRSGGAPPAGNGSGTPDNVAGIAKFFGVQVADIYTLNPGSSSGIHAGQKLKIPPPTR
jgi:hypothetical protein